MNSMTLRRLFRRDSAPAPEDVASIEAEPQEVELPGNVLRVLDGLKLHERAAGESERVMVVLPGVPGLPFLEGPEQAARALSHHFALKPRQLEAAVDYMGRMVKLRKRELRRQKRGPSWATNW